MIKIIEITKLKPHERIRKIHARKLLRQIIIDGRLKKPIIVDGKTGVILDGHHRFWAIGQLGLSGIPARIVNYQDKNIQVIAWRKGEKISKSEVIRAGMTGKLLRPKTSRHLIPKERL
ncbi:MAG: ParB N-terminal domain-containing protein [Candidatus Beckwithbacteria bacterium]